MFATVIDMNGRRIYSSFFRLADEAIAYAQRNPGIIAVEVAHGNKPPIWTRDQAA